MMRTRKQALWACAIATCLQAGFSCQGAATAREASDLRRDATVVAVEKVLPSVVNVATATVVEYPDFYDRLLREFYGWGDSLPREKLNSIGSGVIIDEDGWVLTNLHVLRRASRVEVKLWNGEVYEADPVKWNELSDVALIKLRLPPGVKLTAVKFAADDDLLLGETVLALGNPFGLGGSVTRGILSSKNRRPPVHGVQLNYKDWLQTDAAINPGNSGGPLINLKGELIGLNVAMYRQGQGIGFAIPVKQVTETLSRFFTPEVSSALWFGARVKNAGDNLVVSFVQPGSPAAEAGVTEGQQILAVNGKAVSTLMEFNQTLCSSADHKGTLETQSGSDQKTLRVSMVPFDELISKRLGLSIRSLDTDGGSQSRIPGRAVLYVTDVERDGPADQAGLKTGMLLTGVGDREAKDLLTVADAVSSTHSGDTLSLTVVEPRRLGGGFVQYHQWKANLTVR